MDLDKFIDDFQRILYQSILDDIAIVRRYLTNEKVFAYSLWLADGPRAMGGCACTEQYYLDTIKRLKEHAEDSQYNKEHLEEDIALAEVCVYEWNYSSPFGENDKPFAELWNFLDKAIDIYYNDVYRINKKIETDYSQLILPEITNINGVDQPFFNIIYSLTLNVLLKIKQEGHLNCKSPQFKTSYS